VYPEDGAGLECHDDSPSSCGVPRDAAIEVRFSRFLLPSTATRQSIGVFTRFPDLGVFLSAEYDLVERVVTYRPFGAPWEPGVLYTVRIPFPTEDAPDGFRAFDGVPLEGDGEELRFSFRTARDAPATTSSDAPPSCRDVLNIFGAAGCAGAQCHAGSEPAAGLLLDSGQGLVDTAIRRVSHEAETGPEVGRPLVTPGRFGTQMPIIEPGNPSNSYLMYKVLINPANYGAGDDCVSAHDVGQTDGCPLPSEREVSRIRDAFVRLDPMPPNERALPSIAALRQIADYIAAGASLDDCE
jgi:hypothetical protein